MEVICGMGLEIIQGRSGRKFGGVACNEVQVVEAAGIESMGSILNGFYIVNPTLKSGYDWLSVKAARNTCHFTETPTIDGGATIYVQQMKIGWSGDSIDLMRKVEKMARVGMLIRFKDRTGEAKIIGHPDAPVRMMFDRDNKIQMGEVNRVNGVYRCTSPFFAPGLVF